MSCRKCLIFTVLVIVLILTIRTSVDCGQNEIIEDFFKIFHSLISPETDFDELIRLKDRFLADNRDSPSKEDDLDSLPYFKIMPKFLSTLAPNSETNLEESCFGVAKVCYLLTADSIISQQSVLSARSELLD